MGPNAGEKCPKELLALLEANSRLTEVKVDLDKIDYDVDVLVIGGGGAGSSAAIEAHEAGANVMIVTKLRIGDANTMMAEGGIQAADKENDSPAQHYLDVMGGGHYANRPELVAKLVTEGPAAIKWLNELGVEFDKEADGTMMTTHGGGTSRKRMHAAKDYSGAEIMRTLRDEVLNRQIPVVDFTAAIEIIKDENGRAAGAVLLNMETGKVLVARAKAVIIATGDAIDAKVSSRLIMNIFFKNSPLHDGAMIIGNDRIIAARCTLPISERPGLPARYGMRHKAAVGISERSDADVIVVSEQTGGISFVSAGEVTPVDSSSTLKLLIRGKQKEEEESKK